MRWDNDELLHIFLDEARENLAAMEDGLLDVERQPDDAAAIDALFRAAHTLKGSAATLSLDALSECAHIIEDLLDAIRSERTTATPRVIGVLLQAVDLLRALLPANLGDTRSLTDAERATCDELRRLIDGGDESAASPDAADRAAETLPFDRALSVPLAHLDRLIDLVAEINIVRGIVRGRVMELPLSTRASIREDQQRLDAMFGEVQELIMRARMVPLATLFRRYARTVRDAAQVTGKRAQLRIEHGDVEIDAQIAELIKDPLLHIVRNAVSHGIETPGERERLGKPADANVRIAARRDGPALVIEISDDGRGFDKEKIVARARQLGIDMTNARTEEDIHALVFHPGFSTADRVTVLSGRGVGMDVVLKNVSALRGSIAIRSRSGIGTTVSIRLPLTVVLVPVLPMACGDEMFAMPLDSIVECIDLPAAGRRGVIDLRGEPVPSFAIADFFDFKTDESARRCLVVVRHGRGKAGLIVDRLFESIPAAIKPLGKLFSAFPFVAGSTVLNDGKVALILDADGVVRAMTHKKEAHA